MEADREDAARAIEARPTAALQQAAHPRGDLLSGARRHRLADDAGQLPALAHLLPLLREMEGRRGLGEGPRQAAGPAAEQERKKKAPTAAVIDSQSVRSAGHSGLRGYDAGKKVKGRKRHLLVDTLGLALAVVVHSASVQDRDGARELLGGLVSRYGWLRLIRADGGYAGKLVEWVSGLARHRKVRLEIVRRSDDAKGFVALPKRWIVERTFAWLFQQRRLAIDYETGTDSAEAMIRIAMTKLMLKRIA